MFREILDYIYPSVCNICGEKLASGHNYICPRCYSRLPFTGFHHHSPNRMEQHILGATRYERATACFYYHPDSELSELVENLKYRSMPGLAEEMGRIMGRNIFGSGYFSDIDCVMPIPMHWHKKLHRGYNQAGQLAIGVAEILKKPVFANLRARRMHRTQTGVSRSRRYRNVSGIFRIYRPEELSGYHVLLVDDICTTGSTLASACQELVETVEDVKVSFYTLGFTI